MRYGGKGNSTMAAILISVIILVLVGFYQKRFLRTHREWSNGLSRLVVFLFALVWALVIEAAVILLLMFITHHKATYLVLAIACAALAVFGRLLAGFKKKKAEEAA